MLLVLLLLSGPLAAWAVALVRADGRGLRPPPRSHRHEADASTWPGARGWVE